MEQAWGLIYEKNCRVGERELHRQNLGNGGSQTSFLQTQKYPILFKNQIVVPSVDLAMLVLYIITILFSRTPNVCKSVFIPKKYFFI